MTKREFERRAHLARTLQDLGFTADEAESLRRISNTLQRWYELECGTDAGHIERDEKSGLPYFVPNYPNGGPSRLGSYRVPDREKAAEKRLAGIIAARNDRDYHPIIKTPVSYYLQTDPRGAALYILRPGDVPAGKDTGAYYSRGVCVY